MDYDIRDFGALCDGITLDTKAIQSALDKAHAAGGGRVIIPAGLLTRTGGIQLRSKVELHVANGGILKAADELDDFAEMGSFPSNFNDASGKAHSEIAHALITCQSGEDITLSGPGIIDGNGSNWIVEEGDQIHRMRNPRPRLIVPVGVRGFTVRDLIIRDSANWTLHPVGCEDVLISGVRVRNDLRLPNCDGIDIDHCRQVRVVGCHVEAGDDGIVIKNHAAFEEYGPTEDIVVTGCTVISTSCAIKIGTESFGDFRRIISGNIVDHSNRGLGIQIRDGCTVEDVIFADCIVRTRRFADLWWGKAEVIHISAAERRAGSGHPTIKGITFRNIKAEGESGVLIHAEEGSVIEDIQLIDILDLKLVEHGRYPGGWLDIRPMAGNEHGGCSETKETAFRVHNAKEVETRNCRLPCDTPTWYTGSGLS